MRGSAAFRTGVAPGGALAPAWVRDALWSNAQAVPSLDLRFADNKSLTDATTGANLVTFTRASSGTYVGSDGVLRTAANDVPRFDHNPTTGKSLGLLVEEQRTNLLLQSDSFATSWGITAGVTVTSLGQVGPLGLNATRFTYNASPSQPGPYQVVSTISGTVYTASFWVRGVSSFPSSLNVVFNDGATYVPVTSSWQRVSAQITASVTGSVGFRIDRFPTSNAVYEIAGMQLEAGAFPTSYIPTTTTALTRSADVASITGTNFSSWYRQSEGALLAMYSASTSGPYSSLNKIANFQPVSIGSYGAIAINSGAQTGWFASGNGRPVSATAYFINKQSIAYIGTQWASAANGLISVSNSSDYAGTSTSLAIGGGAVAISRLTYWPTRLADTTLQQITQP
jgi:hypothetical protein